MATVLCFLNLLVTWPYTEEGLGTVPYTHEGGGEEHGFLQRREWQLKAAPLLTVCVAKPQPTEAQIDSGMLQILVT
jgi:hypothetical protein